MTASVIQEVNAPFFSEVDTVILEDQEQALTLLSGLIREIPQCNVFATKDYAEAEERVMGGKCSLFVTDLLIKKSPSSGTRGEKRALEILQFIRDENLLVPSIATSAYDGLLKDAQKYNLAAYYVEKSRNSPQEVRDKTKILALSMYSARTTLHNVMQNLKKIFDASGLEESIEYYDNAKRLIIGIDYEHEYVPASHRKGFWALRNTILYLSPIDSPSLGLRHLKEEAYYLIEKLAINCLWPRFDYTKEGREIIDELSSLGYSSRPFIDLES